MKSRLVVLVLAVSLALSAVAVAVPAASALPGDLIWPRTWNSATYANLGSARVAVAPTGDVYVAGGGDSAATDIDFVVVRYTSAGAFKWARHYDGFKHTDWPTEVATDRAGNVVLCGESRNVAGSRYGFVAVKFSRGGKRLWVHRISSTLGDCVARDVVTDRSGNVYVTGSVTRQATGLDWCTVKYSPSGARLWQRYLSASTSAFEEAESLAIGPDGKLYVGGTVMEPAGTGTDLCVARYTTAGHRDWKRTEGSSGINDYVEDIAVGTAGICAVGVAYNGPDVEGLVWKLSLGGGTWPPYVDSASGAEYRYKHAGIDKYGDLVAAGRIFSIGDYLFWMKRYHPDGSSDTMFEAAGGTGAGSVNGLAVTPDGMIYAAGTVPRAATGFDVFSEGVYPTWLAVFAPFWDGGSDTGDDLALGSGAYYVAGTSSGKLLLLKYAR